MIFRSVTLFALIDKAVATFPAMKKFDALQLQNSKFGKTLTRRLEDENNDDEEEEYSFLSEFNILYQNCFPSSNSISFKLCPSNADCKNGCENGGEYTADFDEFLDAFTEIQLDAHEYRCEMIRENCENDDAEACYEAAGYYDECYQQDQNDDEYKVQQYFECAQYGEYDIWVKAICYDTINIHLAIYADEDCEEEYDVDNWDADEMGEDFPEIAYSIASGTSIIQDQCADCKEHGQENDQNGGDDAEDEDAVIEQCEELFADNVYSCETEYMYANVGYYIDADQSGCEEIEKMQEAEGNFQFQNLNSSSSKISSTALAGIIGVVAVGVVAGVAYQFHSKKKDDTVVETKPNKAPLI
eukprot:CAMPEP_0194146650 /NCGR_PEP_ID=MMETSP0152-20130528/21184_1 /TAXON_ID=1049557 /ORGANISM="Thalassiothrix antarctica, Strain L6-D1" /LENGTH=356 /DNA_ID=CAMNT_0038847213 /DNA_START=47 /DNA_END=1117 /DNA_ORIENTATION=+